MPGSYWCEHGMGCLTRLPSFLGAALLTLFLQIVVRYCDDVQVEEGVGLQLTTVDAQCGQFGQQDKYCNLINLEVVASTS